jgi:hypothetical protein
VKPDALTTTYQTVRTYATSHGYEPDDCATATSPRTQTCRSLAPQPPSDPDREPSQVEAATGWSIKEFVRTARRYRTVQII